MLEENVQRLKHMLTAFGEVGEEFRVMHAVNIVMEEFGQSLDRMQRRSHLMGDMRDEITVQALCFQESFGLEVQFAFRF